MRAKRVLLTGGAGFIGSHLCERLLADGTQVVCLDNFCDFYDPAIKRQNIQECLENPAFTLIEADIRDATQIRQIFAEHEFDLVVHLAAMAGVRPSIENPELYMEVNVMGTVHLLEACAQKGIKSFVFASSSSVYGNNEKVPFSELDNVDNPISPYAATKKAGELLCHTWHKLWGMSIVCLRFFTVYGPRQRPDLAIHKFGRLLLEDQPIPVFGDGSTSRDYTYVDDIIDGLVKSIDLAEKPDIYEIINLGEASTISLSLMIETLELALGKRAIRKPMPLQAGDVQRTFADVSKANRILGYNPSTEFAEGVGRFVQWLRERVGSC